MLFPLKREDPFAPPAAYKAREDGAPLRVRLAYGGDAWLVTGHRTARAVLSDGVTFSSDPTCPGYPAFPLFSKRPVPGHFLAMDAPDHTRLRRTVAAHFTAAQVRARGAAMTAAAAGVVDAMREAGSPGDLVASVSVPLSGLSTSEILGTPLEDLDFFLDRTRDLQRHDVTQAQRAVAAGRLNRYLEKLLLKKKRDPGDDLLSDLAASVPDDGAEPTEDGLTLKEAVGVANLLVIAGQETSAGLLSLTVLSLLRDPAQGDLVRSDPERWAEPAVTEALRYWTLVQHGAARVATRGTELAGQRIRAGDAIIVHLASANRDPAVFAEPDTFDITRETRTHLAFGHGAHHCLGSAVSQAQVQRAVVELFGRLPALRLAGDPRAGLEFLEDMLVYGLRVLPVAW
ncbi:cytochrome P450 [Sphaerisporangium rhizosphaerae]|uniref:Cytochrome P450 n=1 Tax=Sphaerisporangium rhizosphaerae TaxID=2269375 RepID=A0ABW2PD47_9ACTN